MQVAADVIRESFTSQDFATQSVTLSIALSQGKYARARGGNPATDNNTPKQIAAHQLFTGAQQLVSGATILGNDAALQHVRQSVWQTEARTAALERQLVQASPGTGSIVDQIPSAKSPWNTTQGSEREADKYMERLSSLMAHMAANKKLHKQQGHTQSLQASWPLSVAPSPEQQASSFAQASRASAPLQFQAGSNRLGPTSTLRLELQNCLQPIAASVATPEAAYWQNVIVSDNTSVNGKIVQAEVQQLEVTALQASPNTALLAMGSISGLLTILLLQRSSPFAYLEGNAGDAAEAGSTAVTGKRLVSPHLHELPSQTGVKHNTDPPCFVLTIRAFLSWKLHAGLTWDDSSRHIVSVTFGGQLCVWALPQSAKLSPSVSVQSGGIPLQLVFTSSLRQLAAATLPYALPETPVEHAEVVSNHIALLQWHSKIGQLKIWVSAAAYDVLCATIPHPLITSTSDKEESSTAQAASTDDTLGLRHIYHSHQVSSHYQTDQDTSVHTVYSKPPRLSIL